MGKFLLYNATVVTGKKESVGAVAVSGERIESVFFPDNEGNVGYRGQSIGFHSLPEMFDGETIDLTGLHLFAGGIDAHVHFREPGMTHKADISSESLAAAAGGVTSFMDMPNTRPATVSMQELDEKLSMASGRSHVNYGFHLGATNDNVGIICKAIAENPGSFGGVKVFMGSSTGNMLVDNPDTLTSLFSITDKPVLVHAEDEAIIKANTEAARNEYGEDIPFSEHCRIRSRQACIKSSVKALEYAMKHGTRLHLLHISTKEEVEMIRAAKAINPKITAETSSNYLWFSDMDYRRLGSHVKCNPSVKTAEDRSALREALRNGIIDTIGSDHAPHLLSEKEGKYLSVPSGMPSIQQSFPALLTIASQEGIPLSRIASAFSEKPAEILHVRERGFIKAGYYADLVIADLNCQSEVHKEDLLYRCGWSPYEGEIFSAAVRTVFVNGHEVIGNGKPVMGAEAAGQKIAFYR